MILVLVAYPVALYVTADRPVPLGGALWGWAFVVLVASVRAQARERVLRRSDRRRGVRRPARARR